MLAYGLDVWMINPILIGSVRGRLSISNTILLKKLMMNDVIFIICGLMLEKVLLNLGGGLMNSSVRILVMVFPIVL
jgi:hypothetical protein